MLTPRKSGALVAAMAVVALGLVLTTPALAVPPSSLPSGEHMTGHAGQAAVEPAYNDMNGQLIYILTPIHAPVHANSTAWAPLYIVVYPANSTVGTLNCMGVPGNCPDHDGLVAGAATALRPAIYGTNASAVLGHDHLLAAPASGGDFNIAWEVYLILFNNTSAINQHITTLSEITSGLASGQLVKFNSGIVFPCAVVSQATYDHGTPVP